MKFEVHLKNKICFGKVQKAKVCIKFYLSEILLSFNFFPVCLKVKYSGVSPHGTLCLLLNFREKFESVFLCLCLCVINKFFKDLIKTSNSNSSHQRPPKEFGIYAKKSFKLTAESTPTEINYNNVIRLLRKLIR